MSVQMLGAGGYRVEGCGTRITYTCLYTGWRVLCEPNLREVAPETEVAAAPPTWTDEEIRALFERIRDDVGRCLPEGTEVLDLRIAVTEGGSVRRTPAPEVSESIAACVDARLASERMSRVARDGRAVIMRFPRAAQRPDDAIFVPPAPAVAPSAEGMIRAAVDARAPAILACVDDAALALQVSWTRDGHLDALLRGDRQGTPEEACVRAIVQALTVAAPGAPGTIVHAVQR